jgi:hypothetical protein
MNNKTVSKTRVILDDKYKLLADKILEESGISTYSQLFAVLLKVYGERLISNLKD